VEIADLKKKTLVIELLKHHQTTEDEAFDKRHQLGSIPFLNYRNKKTSKA